MGECAAVLPNFISGKIVHVSFSRRRQLDRILVHLVEVVRRIADMVSPVETEPADVFDNGLYILSLLLHRIGVVKAQVAETAIFLRQPEIEADRFGVTDMQITVWLRRKTGMDAALPLPALHISIDNLLDKVLRPVFLSTHGEDSSKSPLADGSLSRAAASLRRHVSLPIISIRRKSDGP